MVAARRRYRADETRLLGERGGRASSAVLGAAGEVLPVRCVPGPHGELPRWEMDGRAHDVATWSNGTFAAETSETAAVCSAVVHATHGTVA